MDNGIKVRLLSHRILYKIHNSTKNIDIIFNEEKKDKLSSRDVSFIYNVCLNTMRYYFYTKIILSRYTKKRTKLNAEILLLTAITQIIYLNFKEYAVVNSTVEIAKKLKINPGFINASLRKIHLDKKQLEKTKIKFDNFPLWFKKETHYFNYTEKEKFIENVCEEPSLHLVFKNKEYKKKFKEHIFSTSDCSGFLINKKKVENIYEFKKGNWWIQDYSSSFPLNNISEKILDKNNIDMCAAPGGKSFQVLSKKKKIILNDINKKRILILKENLKRLNFKTNITNLDFEKINEKIKYNFVIVDAPCSAVGTIRKNPEIFFRKKQPDLKKLTSIQEQMLKKATKILHKNGVLLYMVCSFLKIETIDQIENFLKKNQNFKIDKFYVEKNNYLIDGFVKNNIMMTLPTKIQNYNTDGYFAIFLRKIN